MEQFEQLLTCCVCLDRYRNPKLLPCQHSFCMEPCMEGLTDYVRKQVKCPECRAEHRVPYQGIQAFPTNVTLQRFLELHIDITGELPDPTAGQIMERCGVCSEKQYLSTCAHCEKKICEDCKSAHMDILRREITRINSQIKRSIHRLNDALSIIEKNTGNLQANCFSVTEELDEIYRRVTKTIKDRTDELRSQVELYLTAELRKLKTLKSNLELEIGNIVSNCDLGEKHMNDNIDWDDCELMDTKEIFLKTVEFLRNFEYESNESSKRIRFFMNKDPNQLVKDIALLGELNFPQTISQASNHLAPPSSMQAGLSRSKSDHRLTQFRPNDDLRYDDEPVLGGRKFGERPVKTPASSDYESSSRYGRNTRTDDYDYDEPTTRTKRNFRSRFVKSHQNDDVSDNEYSRGGRSGNTAGQDPFKNGERVIDTEDVSRGQLSGIIRLQDCSRVIKRLQDSGKSKKEKKAADKAAAPATSVQPAAVRPKPAVTPAAAARQISQEDEISRIKRQNKQETTSSAVSTVVTPAETERPTSDRVSALRQQPRPTTQSTSEESDSSAQNTHQTSVQAARKSPQVEADSDSEETDSDDDTSPPTNQQSKPPPVPATTGTSNATTSKPKVVARTTSTESTESTESSSSTPATSTPAATTNRTTTASNTNQNSNTNSRYGNTQANSTTKTPTSSAATTAPAEKKPFQSRFLPNHSTAATTNNTKKQEIESSSETETSSEEESEDEVDTTKKSTTTPASSSTTTTTPTSRTNGTVSNSTAQNSIGNRSTSTAAASAADSTSSSRRSSRDDTNARTSAYSSPSSYTPRTRTVPAPHHDTEPDRYSSTTGSSYTSRFLNRSKSSAILPPALNTSLEDDATGDDSDSRYGTGRSRYLAMKERRSRLARSRSSHALGGDDDDLDDPPVSPTTASPSAYLASRETPIRWPKNIHPDSYIPNIKRIGYGPSSYSTEGSALSRSRSSHALKSRETSPVASDRGAASGTAKDGEALSSWARYLKNKYGNRKESTRDALASSTTPTSHTSPSSMSSASRRLSLGLPLRQANEYGSSDDDGSKNGLGSPTSPTVAAGITGLAGISPKTLYLRKRQQLFQLGGRGSEPGSFTWPRGIAVGPDNSIVVADSSNHRVQVFDSNGIFVKEFGEYGNAEGEFDCLAGVAVNRIGQYIIADRYNHRIQVLDPQGRFLRAFGSQGTADGKFSYPWGVTTDSLGFIYVCDKENHRVQVFQSDGTFVGKFGTCGREEGQLEHPHYIAVSNTNRVIVSDSNNHRIQIFDVNGKVLSTFGGEGSDEGQFKFPRGVAVDDQGYICVADSGNNRIQIFNPDGSFLRAFGSWGSGDCEFKGLEGVAIMSNGNVLVCDRENHRVQVF